MVADIDQIAGFTERYRSFTQGLDSKRFAEFCSHFRRLQFALLPLRALAEAEQRRTAATFNIFQVLGVAHDEVNTHSALLAHLLDPHEDHAQGTLFLERFLRFCAQQFPELAAPSHAIPLEGWTVKAEFNTAEGVLDLVVWSSRLGVLYVVENKIWAGEQPDQLLRYTRWLKQQASFPHRALFYLTPDGRPSQTHNGETYLRLSYKEHIVPWLTGALSEVEAPRLVETLKQYLDVLRDL